MTAGTAVRIQKGRYIEEGENFKRLSDLGLMPGTSFYFKDVQEPQAKRVWLI
jgi:hypothetical protein